MAKLAPGMTVQSPDTTSVGSRWRVAFCVRCGWQSGKMSHEAALALAKKLDSHACPKKKV